MRAPHNQRINADPKRAGAGLAVVAPQVRFHHEAAKQPCKPLPAGKGNPGDRLGRNVSFIASMMDCKVDFVCCDNPHAKNPVP